MKRNTTIKTPVYFNMEVEQMIRQMLKDNRIKEATKESKFCAGASLFKRLVTNYQEVNQLISTDTILRNMQGYLPWVSTVDILSG